VVGHAHQHGRLVVRPGESLRLHGVHYTDDCQVADAGSATTIPSVQLILQSKMRIGAIATVHPHGPNSAFLVRVTIPATTFPGLARILDTSGPGTGSVGLVVRR